MRVSNESQKKTLSPAHPTAEKLRPNPSPKSTFHEPSLLSNPKPPSNLVPIIKSDKSDLAANSPSVTNFLCPIDKCSFNTTKQGMMDGAAATHLNKVHMITGPDMKNAPKGTYKFKKVKGEIKV